jgi:hypothetical protein
MADRNRCAKAGGGNPCLARRIAQMRLPNVKFAPTGVPTVSEMVGMAAQAVGDGLCHTCLVIYPTGNLEGRYRRGGENADDYARGARQWTARWGNHGGISLHDCRARP